jgi:hypothetical protein
MYSPLVPSSSFEDCADAPVELFQVCQNVVVSQERAEEFANAQLAQFDQFWILFQTLFLGFVIVLVGKWFFSLFMR